MELSNLDIASLIAAPKAAQFSGQGQDRLICSEFLHQGAPIQSAFAGSSPTLLKELVAFRQICEGDFFWSAGRRRRLCIINSADAAFALDPDLLTGEF
ncbi:hypothetical protein [Ensifer aridi]|uniref:hypothetical protein n=1 Tax=Ensifer aridi TaxID=1708715 RepID=UPI0015E43C95|nr:hypothetical protein [Ensifer aridi]